MALGIALSDILLITICYIGASTFFDNVSNKLFIGIIGGFILIGYGLYTVFRKPKEMNPKLPPYHERSFLQKYTSHEAKMITYSIKGFFMNLLNPFLLIFWLTAMGWVSANAPEGKLFHYAIAFFCGTICTVFSLDLLKSLIGTRISKYLRPENILWINRIVGVALSVFGIFLILKVLTDFV